mmetsp:Transcript_29323/g.41137  ORF Transcript_29323/g.41137 Transcript_29323/m.41137 type:complete len:220 (+) Transcript_29323:57-716(+)
MSEIKLPKNVQQVLDAKNHFEIMGLPLPQWDALGMALWTVTDLEIKSAFKKLSLLTHPDKNRNNLEAARDAFEKVKAAHEVISDEMLRDDYIKKYIDENKTVEASNWVPPKDGAELEKELEVEMKKQEDKATLMKKHYASFQDKIKEKNGTAAQAQEGGKRAPTAKETRVVGLGGRSSCVQEKERATEETSSPRRFLIAFVAISPKPCIWSESLSQCNG